MNTRNSIITMLCASAAMASAGVTVIDFGAIQDNCCGDSAHTLFTGTVEAGDPAAVAFVHPNAATAPGNSSVQALSDGATLSWTNVSAWNNTADGLHPAQTFFLNRAIDPLDTFFTVTTANPGDLVTIDFIAGPDRDALITIDGTGTVVPNSPDPGPGTWTNVLSGSAGTVTGELTENAADEGNVGAMRITITPVPEPSGVALLGLSAALMAFRRRR